MKKEFFVYMMASQRYGTIYTGVTSNLIQRVYQHKHGLADGFTKKHNCKILVWYEHHYSAESAIIKEKQIKNWKRDWKINRIQEMNYYWDDLYNSIL
jgi:putative endonuclease